MATRAELLRPGFSGTGVLSPEALAGATEGSTFGLAADLAGTAFLGAASADVFWDSTWLAGWLDLAAVFTVLMAALDAGWTFSAGLAVAWAGAWVFFG
jgi:hypothetical protein